MKVITKETQKQGKVITNGKKVTRKSRTRNMQKIEDIITMEQIRTSKENTWAKIKSMARNKMTGSQISLNK